MNNQAPTEIRQALQPFRRRIRLANAAEGASYGLLAVSIACAAWLASSFLTPIMDLPLRMLLSGALLLALAVLLSLVRPVSLIAAARRADACGLKERALTALTALHDTPMTLLLREDAVRHLDALPPRRAIPLFAQKRPLYAAGLVAVATVLALFLPNPMGDLARQREGFRAAMEQQAKKAEAASEKLEEDAYTKEELAALRKQLGDLAKSLRSSTEPRDALLALDQARQQMEHLQKQSQSSANALSNAARSLAQSGMEGLSKALSEANRQAVAEEMQKLAKAGKQDGESISDAFEGAASAMQAGPLSDAFLAAAKALGTGAQGDQAMQDLSGMLQNACSGQASGDMSQLLAQVRSGILSASQATGAAALAMGQGTGSGQGSGVGQGSGTGQNQGQGAGGGAGRGTTNQDAGTSSSAGTTHAAGTGAPEYRLGKYESIYDPTRLEGGEEQIAATGQMHEGEGLKVQLGPGLGDASGQVPYRDVIMEYKNAASQAADRALLPQSVQQWVDGYFSALTD